MAQKICFLIEISSDLITSNSVIFSFLSYFRWYWPQKLFQKIYNSVYGIFLGRPTTYYVEKKSKVVKAT